MGLLSNVAWMSKAKCVDEDHKLFISYEPELIKKAKSICSQCPVKLPCADQYFDVSCVAGGLSYYDRLVYLWKEVGDISESNWRNPAFLLRKLSRQASEGVLSD